MGTASIKGRRVKRCTAFLISLLILSAASSMPASYAAQKDKADNFVHGGILYREDFEDGNLAASDPGLVNGMTWTANGALATGTVNSYDSKIIRMNAGAYILSDQVINQPEYTVSFTCINWYNTAARVMVAYRDKSNYYSFSPATGQVYRCMNGVEEELGTDNVRRLISSPRQNPSVNRYKIYFCNDGGSITISVDRDGYDNRKDYEFTYIDSNTAAVKRFTGGRIKLARTDESTSRFRVNFDNILITKGKLQASLPRGPAKLYVSNRGDDSYEGTEKRPLKLSARQLRVPFPVMRSL